MPKRIAWSRLDRRVGSWERAAAARKPRAHQKASGSIRGPVETVGSELTQLERIPSDRNIPLEPVEQSAMQSLRRLQRQALKKVKCQ
ncbi:MAG: hypothetical protein CBB71_07595 [Rhodopirellula sp. TMED11]|nr:MAG: hypothetical protein CBB71_07595 [Rhodopirellula sp. TMED11]